ncbi:GntR family transcriptional regulator [Ancylobacter sp. A5.8]|uniref:GntR family transcriptional regulator n=1 Tax=Ancylobacter gelatini TaxID=2919920 RepID=UPI001F4D61F5|nr:GntR family transcriptional regulator [Ancylobacter gelatini]MCJ8142013.1 GntR family transcriptional regulator [Ancylobacter gelatini]
MKSLTFVDIKRKCQATDKTITARLIILSTIEMCPSGETHVDRIFTVLEHDIVSGQLAMGSKLGEELLASRFGVSRGPLREALRRLEGRGLVIRTAHAGVRVVALSRKALLELYEIRELLEGLAARLAARNMSEEEVASLRALLDEDLNSGLRSDAYPLVFGDADFHYRIAEGSKSVRLKQLLCGDLYSLIRLCRFKTAHVPGQMQSFRDHMRIIEAIEDRDEALAEFLMSRHISAARARFLTTPFNEASDAVDSLKEAGFA